MSASVELQDIRLDSEAEPEPEARTEHHTHDSANGNAAQGVAEEQAEGEEKAGLNPDSFSLVEAAQYGNLERY